MELFPVRHRESCVQVTKFSNTIRSEPAPPALFFARKNRMISSLQACNVQSDGVANLCHSMIIIKFLPLISGLFFPMVSLKSGLIDLTCTSGATRGEWTSFFVLGVLSSGFRYKKL